jgi:WS/DGAT/MGAT family acyltransferase
MAESQGSGDRMTALDAAFFNLERTGQLLHVGGVYTVEGGLDYEAMVADLGSRMHLIPRYTQRVVPVPFGLGLPTWEPARGFDVRLHVLHHTLRPPGDDEQLRRLASRLFAQRLDRSRPLWELHQIDGYHGDGSAIVAKVHHCMIDGVSGVQLMNVMFDPSPNPAPFPPAPEAVPAPPLPTPSAQAWRAIREGVAGAVARVQYVGELLRDPARARAELQAVLDALGEMLALAFAPVPSTPFNGHVSTLRRIEWVTFSLNEVKAVKNRLGGTVNDVVLTTIAAALRRYLEGRGLEPDRMELRAMCPVNVRSASEHLALGNRVSAMVAPLPVGIFDPLERLRQVRAAMQQQKRAGESAKMSRMLDLMGLLPAPLQAQLGWLPMSATPINTVCTNVPGPPVSLYVQGKRLETLVPMVPLAQGIGLAFAILSYADTLTIGITSDPALIRDADHISGHLREGFEELRELAGVERVERRGPVRSERQRRSDATPSQVA